MDVLIHNPLFATHAVSAAAAITFATAATHPLDTVKTLIQVGSGAAKQLTAAQALERVTSSSGFAGLYNGIGWSILGRISGLGFRFGAYEILTAYCKDGREYNYVHVSEAFWAGVAAGAAESVLTTPFQMIQLRAQVASAASAASHVTNSASVAVENAAMEPGRLLVKGLLRGYAPNKAALANSVNLLSTLPCKNVNLVEAMQGYPWMMSGSGRAPPVWRVKRASDIVSLEGWGALWRGMRSGIARDSIFGGVFFSTWQLFHSAMLEWKAVGMVPPPPLGADVGPLSPLAVTVSAGVSGAIAAAASHGFDTAKSRAECVVIPKHVAYERKLLKWKRPGNRFERYTGIHPRDRNLLVRGISLRMACSGLATFMIVGGYFLAVDNIVSR
uniref:Mitochondrial carrier protein n=1 Tax=Kalanchoe fedtschenkoi TaxID=63787 RepID=A0A7N1A4I8_KALFE